MSWFILQTRGGAEAKAAKHVRKTVAEVFYPRLRRRDIRGHTREHAAVTGYLVVDKPDGINAYDYHAIISVDHGVYRFLGDKDVNFLPKPVSETVINGLKAQCDALGYLHLPEPVKWRPRAGDLVKIITGPELGAIGRVLSAKKSRLVVKTYLFGRLTSLYCSLERCIPHSEAEQEPTRVHRSEGYHAFGSEPRRRPRWRQFRRGRREHRSSR